MNYIFCTLKKNLKENANKKIPPEIMPHCEKSKTNPYHYPNHRFCLHFEALFNLNDDHYITIQIPDFKSATGKSDTKRLQEY